MSLFLVAISRAEQAVVAFQVAPLDEVVISASSYEQKIFDTNHLKYLHNFLSLNISSELPKKTWLTLRVIWH